MFDFLKKRLKKSVETLTKKIEEAPEKKEVKKEKKEKPEKEKKIEKAIFEKKEIIEKEPEIEEKERLGLRERITKKALSDKDINSFFDENETELLQSNIALEVIDFLRKDLKEKLVSKPIKRGKMREFVSEAFESVLFDTVNQGSVDLEKKIKNKKPLLLVFLGFNGSGKTTSIAKLAEFLIKKKHKIVLAAADTFRAASIEQLETHGERLGVKVIKHQYGADSAAVVFDAVKFANSKGYDFVLADTAGRSHTDKNLMDELEKVCRVNKPVDLKILVVDSLTGNDAVEQAKRFDDTVGVDAVILTKTDVNEKGGSILSVCYAIKKPILFLGTGQEYKDMELFNAKHFVEELMK